MPARRGDRGGDWCETFAISDDVIALSIGDVCGHGSGCFDTMVAVRRAVYDAAHSDLDPALTLVHASRFLRRLDPHTHATAIFGLLDTRRGRLTFANAGHPPPLVAGADDSAFLTFPKSDLPLGVAGALVPMLHVMKVPSDSLLVFYTDGVTEHEYDAIRGEAQLRNAALFAYQHWELPSASVIERQMFLTGTNHDDAAILTAWTPAESAPTYANFRGRKPRESATKIN
jgi:serine phosphatase RsbU (regulator of sigma subunit)